MQNSSLMESSSEEIIRALLLMPDRLLTNGAFAAALESPAAKLCNFKSFWKNHSCISSRDFLLKEQSDWYM